MDAAAKSEFSIWVDADACPREARELLSRNAERRGIPTRFVANSYMRVPESVHLSFRLVPQGADRADDHIVENAGPEDIAVTGDIPLAARLVEKGVAVLSPRGEDFTSANIGERLAMRNLMDKLRSSGLPTAGPEEFTRADANRFANALDRLLTKRLKANRRDTGLGSKL